MRKLDAKGIHMVAGQRRNLAMPSEAADIETREGSVEFVPRGSPKTSYLQSAQMTDFQ